MKFFGILGANNQPLISYRSNQNTQPKLYTISEKASSLSYTVVCYATVAGNRGLCERFGLHLRFS